MKINKVLVTIIATIMLINLSFVNVRASEDNTVITKDELHFDKNKGIIIQYSGSGEELIIPEYIDNVRVNSIQWSVFGGKTNLKKVVLPKTIVNLGPYDFAGCTNLESITFNNCISNAYLAPENEPYFKEFYKCNSIKEVNLLGIYREDSIDAFTNFFRRSDIALSEIENLNVVIFKHYISDRNNVREWEFECDLNNSINNLIINEPSNKTNIVMAECIDITNNLSVLPKEILNNLQIVDAIETRMLYSEYNFDEKKVSNNSRVIENNNIIGKINLKLRLDFEIAKFKIIEISNNRTWKEIPFSNSVENYRTYSTFNSKGNGKYLVVNSNKPEDVDRNSRIDLLDLGYAAKNYNQFNYQDTDVAYSDVNNDSVVDIYDLVRISRLL